MKIKLLIEFLFIIYSLNCFAQKRIEGTIIEEDNSAVIYANVWLYSASDTTKSIKNTLSDENGKFILDGNFAENQYLLRISTLGFETKVINIAISQDFIDIGKIVLNKSTINLNEVTVTANMINTFGSKEVFMFTSEDKKKSKTGLDLMTNIPQLFINNMNNTITKSSGGVVKILINGTNATETELLSLKPEEIIKVEYSSDPPSRYANLGIDALINVIVKRKTDNGGNINTNLKNSFTTGYGNDMINGKYHFGQNEFSLIYLLDYRDLNKNIYNQNWDYTLHDGNYNIMRDGTKGSYVGSFNNILGGFSRSDENNYFFNSRLYFGFNPGKEDYLQNVSGKQAGQEIENGTARNFTKSNYKSSTLDLYLSKKVSDNQEFILNLVGTYYNSNSEKSNEEDSQNLYIYSNHSKFDNNSYSIIPEFVYNKNYKEHKFEAGIRYYYKFLKEKYSSDINDVSNYQLQDLYYYTSLSGKYKIIDYSIGLGGQQVWINKDDSKDYFVVKPNISLTYKNKKSSFNFRSVVESFTPDISMLSNNPVYIDSTFISKGNSNLKPYYNFKNQIQYSYTANKFYFQTSFAFNYANQPFYTVYENSGYNAIKTYSNQDYLRRYVTTVSARWNPTKWLKIIPSYSVSYNTSEGNNLLINNWTQSINFYSSVSYKDFVYQIQISPLKTFFEGQAIQKTGAFYYSDLTWKKKSLSLTLAYVYNVNASNYYTCPDIPIYYRESKEWHNFANLLFLQCTYSFSFGKKLTNNASQKLYNSDSDPGLLNDSKARP